MTVDFNINEWVSVRLTDLGRAHHRFDFDCWTAAAGIDIPYNPPKEDAEGWSKWQLWSLMQTFGPIVGVALPPPFEANIKFHATPTKGPTP